MTQKIDARPTERKQNGWQEYEYRSPFHGGVGWYWERPDGLRLSLRQSGAYFPPEKGWNIHQGGLPNEYLVEHQGEHIRFVYGDQLMFTIGEEDYPRFLKDPDEGLSIGELTEFAEEMWPRGHESEWKGMGIKAELS